LRPFEGVPASKISSRARLTPPRSTPRTGLHDRADGQQRHDGDHLTAHDDFVDVHRRPPGDVAVLDDERADRGAGDAEPAAAALPLGGLLTHAAAGSAAHLRDGYDDHVVLFFLYQKTAYDVET